ncbi:MAG TPA: hypothetical protein VN642_17760 [Dongiaceae bacterium]|nr:hypothetical protein [Dongiaceae bacterium]
MRSINYVIKGAMLGMVLVLSASPALAFGENMMEIEKAKVEVNKVEVNKVDINKGENVMKAEDHGDSKVKAHEDAGALLDEGLLGEDILGEALLGIED